MLFSSKKQEPQLQPDLSYVPAVSSAAGTDHEIAAADPPAARTGGRQLKLEWGFLFWAF